MTQADYARHAGISRPMVCKLVKAGMPLTSPEAADAFRGMGRGSQKKRAQAAEQAGPYRPPEAAQAPVQSSSEDGPAGAYERQRQIERAAYELATKALKAGTLDAARLVQIHSQAASNLVSARKEVLKLLEQERALVSGDWVRKVMTEHDGALVQIVKGMPNQLATRISPHDPDAAREELSRWVEESFLKVLFSTTPWEAKP